MQEKNKSYEKTNSEFVEFVSIPQKVTSIQKSPQITHRTHGDSSQSSPHTHTIPIPMGIPMGIPIPTAALPII